MTLRIDRLSLCNFRAFPHPVDFNLQTKNLIVYGENGAGKSSIFEALRNFFATRPSPIASVRNVFSGRPDADFKVEVAFSDGSPAVTWSAGRHPTNLLQADPRVTEAALRKSCLDYRALLDTNYLHGTKRPNLFDITVSALLADFPVPIEGGIVKTISHLWADVGQAKPWNYNSSLEPVQKACIVFNEALRMAMDALHPWLVTLAGTMLGPAIEVRPYNFGGVTYQHEWWKRDRVIRGRELYPDIAFHGYGVDTPQLFLNEARLSALALAMYLGGRLACVPTAGNRLKLLVLDDVLIGLDHDNRIPVLRVLQQHFADWQIVLLTHDRVWFDMARQFHDGSDEWTWAEIFSDGDGGRATPSIKKPNGDIVRAALDECAAHLASNVIPSAATSARRAYEWALKRFCEKRRIFVPFTMNQKDNDSEVLMNGITTWAGQPGNNRAARLPPILADLRMYRAGVLNPQTHANAPNPSRQEVEGAVDAIRRLEAARTDNTIT
ncbi:AAA family ATPase [Sinorhizobium meliloti]|nr:AAA family ATPase [Sinorhizobium meliloti]